MINKYNELHAKFLDLINEYHNHHIRLLNSPSQRNVMIMITTVMKISKLIKEIKKNNVALRKVLISEKHNRYKKNKS